MRSAFIGYSASFPSGAVAEYDELGPYLSIGGAQVGGESEASLTTSNVSQSKSSALAPLLYIPRLTGPISQSNEEKERKKERETEREVG